MRGASFWTNAPLDGGTVKPDVCGGDPVEPVRGNEEIRVPSDSQFPVHVVYICA